MADTKISALTGATTPLAGTEVIPVVQGGQTRKVSVADLTTGRAISATNLTLTTGNLIVSSGQGIDFSATGQDAGMTSELLDDYEEGTFTPTVSSGVGSPTYTTQAGKYTKIGRLVYFSIALKLSGGTPAAGQIRFSGLPFTTENAAPYGAAYVGYSGNFVTAGTTIYLPNNNTRLDFYKSDGTIFAGTDSPAITGDIYVNGFYVTA
jgi:hypothetical protein